MKKLLNKSVVPFFASATIAVLLSIPLFYLAVQYIYTRDTDESLLIAKQKFMDSVNESPYGKEEVFRRISMINEFHTGFQIHASTGGDLPADSIYTIHRFDAYHGHVEPFRVLETTILIHQIPFHLKIELDMEEYYDIVPYIAMVAAVFFLMILLSFHFINRYISFRIWRPFYQMLEQLENYRINDPENLVKIHTDTLEFSKLQRILNKFISRNKALFLEMRSFTENASHELQTPLAIVKNKLDLLMQKESLTNRQYRLIEESYGALTRMSRIKKNLLLLTKIENRQFSDNEAVDMSQLANQCLEQLKEHFDHKNRCIKAEIVEGLTIEGNKTLVEILINNLLLNAIRHNQQNGKISIFLDGDGLAVSNSGTAALDPSTLFRRFVKTSSESPGSGLGLAIVKEVCNFHKWAIAYRFESGCHYFLISF